MQTPAAGRLRAERPRTGLPRTGHRGPAAPAGEAEASSAQAGDQASEAQASSAEASSAQVGETQPGSVQPGTPGHGGREPRPAPPPDQGGPADRGRLAVLVIAGVTIGTLSGAAHRPARPRGRPSPPAQPARPRRGAQVVSVTEGGATTGTDGATPVQITLSAPLAATSPLPAMGPAGSRDLEAVRQHPVLHPGHPVRAEHRGPGALPGRGRLGLAAPPAACWPGGPVVDHLRRGLVQPAAEATAGPAGLPPAGS